MKVPALICGACAAVATAGGTGMADGATTHPRAELTRFACRQAQNPHYRELAVTAVMRPVSGTQHMAIEFSLFRQLAGSQSFTHVRGGDLDTWIGPKDPTLGQRPGDVWKLAKLVSNLAGPAVYRLRVSFRWSGAHGVLSRAVRTTGVCRAD